MAWDTEETRRRLYAAAAAEFAAYGPAGTTMSRIAKRAGINKERLYRYYGDKEALFRTVLTVELERLSASVAVPEGGYADIGEFAARTFDYHAAHPELARLLQWEGLDHGPIADEARRTRHYREKVERLAAAQRAGVLDDSLDPAYAVLTVIALAAWWISVPQLARMLTGREVDAAELARRRAFVARAAERLLAPRPDDQ